MKLWGDYRLVKTVRKSKLLPCKGKKPYKPPCGGQRCGNCQNFCDFFDFRPGYNYCIESCPFFHCSYHSFLCVPFSKLVLCSILLVRLRKYAIKFYKHSLHKSVYKYVTEILLSTLSTQLSTPYRANQAWNIVYFRIFWGIVNIFLVYIHLSTVYIINKKREEVNIARRKLWKILYSFI